MSTVTEANLVCDGCGRRFAWKPAYAGKSLKCKCGQVIKAPAKAPMASAAERSKPAAKPAPAAIEDDFDRLCAQAEYELSAAEAAATSYAAPISSSRSSLSSSSGGNSNSGRAAAAAPLGPSVPSMLGYMGTGRQPLKQEAVKGSPVKDLIAPIVLIVVGVLALYFEGWWMDIRNPVVLTGFVLAKALINLPLVFIAMLMAVRMIDLGLGPIGPALVKIAAVALLPSAVAGTIGGESWALRFALSLATCAALMAYLFEMDYHEIVISVGIIWTIQTWLTMLILGLIFSLGGAGAGRHLTAMANPRGAPTPPPPGYVVPHISAEQQAALDRSYAELNEANEDIRSGRCYLARIWLKIERHEAPPGMTNQQVIDWADKFYAAGSTRVWVTDVERFEEGRQVCTKMLVESPPDDKIRAAIVKVRDQLHKPELPTADQDIPYLIIPLTKQAQSPAATEDIEGS